MDVSSHRDSAGEFSIARSTFSMRLSIVRFMSKVIKLLLTELVGQCVNTVLPSAFFALTSLWSVNAEKSEGNIFLY